MRFLLYFIRSCYSEDAIDAFLEGFELSKEENGVLRQRIFIWTRSCELEAGLLESWFDSQPGFVSPWIWLATVGYAMRTIKGKASEASMSRKMNLRPNRIEVTMYFPFNIAAVSLSPKVPYERYRNYLIRWGQMRSYRSCIWNIRPMF